jgi:L-ascorbate metabolism protein UlaG (beta-lactamase superfamily)
LAEKEYLMIERIEWLGRSSFAINGPPLIYINPTRAVRNAPPADVILISRASYDNCSPRALQTLCKPDTLIIANDNDECLAGLNVQVLRPWQSVTIQRTRITSVPTHPTRSPELPDRGAPVGFLVSMDFYDIYYAGDSIVLPDTVALRPDIAILPVRNARSGLLEIEHAIEVVKTLNPRWVIPSHWSRSVGGSYLDVKAFEAAVGELAEVIIPTTVQ